MEIARNFRPRRLTFTWWRCCGLYLGHKPNELAHFLFILFLCLFLSYGPFNFISFHKFSRQMSVLSLCSSGLISALLVLSTICRFMKVFFSPDTITSGSLGSKHQLTTSYHAGNGLHEVHLLLRLFNEDFCVTNESAVHE